MTDDAKRALIATWFDQLEPHPLDESREEDRRLFVDLDAWVCSDGAVRSLRGHSVESSGLNKVFDTILIAAPGSTHLFAGFPGTGKTTELNRLARLLSGNLAPGFSVLRVNARKYHGMNEALSIEEMAMLLVAGIGESALESLGERALPRAKKSGIWEYVNDRLRAMLDGAVTIKLGVADIKPALFKGGGGLRDQLRGALGERGQDKLRDFVHGLIYEITTAIAPRRLVVMVDDLEKYTVSRENVAAVYQQMADLFFLHGSLLKLPDCHTIYTVPPYLAFLNPGIRAAFDGNVHLLPSVKVQSRPPDRKPYHEGIAALTQIVASRVDLDALFGQKRGECMARLVLASGGHLRDLMIFMKDVVLMGLRRPLPLGLREVEEVITQNGSHRGNLLKDDIDVLLEVSKLGTLGSVRKDRLGAFAGVMDQHLMLCYANDAFWYDAHPIITPMLQQARMAQASDEPA